MTNRFLFALFAPPPLLRKHRVERLVAPVAVSLFFPSKFLCFPLLPRNNPVLVFRRRSLFFGSFFFFYFSYPFVPPRSVRSMLFLRSGFSTPSFLLNCFSFLFFVPYPFRAINTLGGPYDKVPCTRLFAVTECYPTSRHDPILPLHTTLARFETLVSFLPNTKSFSPTCSPHRDVAQNQTRICFFFIGQQNFFFLEISSPFFGLRSPNFLPPFSSRLLQNLRPFPHLTLGVSFFFLFWPFFSVFTYLSYCVSAFCSSVPLALPNGVLSNLSLVLY